jgi:phosphohistidine phosphatase
MKRLLLYRHAKSDWNDPALEDFARPLAPRGRKAAPKMAAALAERGWRPDLVLCSAALRTQQTWELSAPALGEVPEVRVQRSLYLASPSQILRQIHRTAGDVGSLMVIGHNPGMESLAARLASRSEATPELERLRDKFPTAAVAAFAVEADAWSQLAPETCRLEAFLRPRDL